MPTVSQTSCTSARMWLDISTVGQQRGFAGAVRADQTVGRAFLDGQVDRVQSGLPAVVLGQASCLDDHRSSRPIVRYTMPPTGTEATQIKAHAHFGRYRTSDRRRSNRQ